MKFVGYIESGEDRDFARIDGQRSGRNLTHALIDVFGQFPQILRIAVRARRISLVVDLNLDGRRSVQIEVSVEVYGVGVHPLIASASSGSTAAILSRIRCTLILIASRSASRRSFSATSSSLAPARLRRVTGSLSRSSLDRKSTRLNSSHSQ